MVRVITFVRRIAGLLEPSLESEFYEEFSLLSKHLDELIVVSDIVDSTSQDFKIHRAWTIKIPKIYGLTKILSYCYSIFKYRKTVDVIYVRTFSPPEIFALLFGKKFLRKKVVLLIPGTWIFEPPTLKNRLFKWFFFKAVKISDIVILYTPLMLSELSKYYPNFYTFKEKIIYIHNAVNTKRFSPGNPDIYTLSKYSLPINKQFILYVGRISSRKGVLDLIKAFSIVNEHVNNTVLLIVGKEDIEYGRKVRELIKTLGLINSILLLGPIPNRDVVEIIRACELFVYASVGGEGIPRAILEAMACGKPVVATNIAGTSEAVKNGVTGFLVEAGDYRSLANYIIRILKDQRLKVELGTNARALIEREFSYDVIIPILAKSF